jgi:hypothetical protein
LCGSDPDDAGEAEVDVDLGDHAHSVDSEGDMCALAGDLAGLGIERRRSRVPEDALDVDLAAALRVPLLEGGATGIADGAGDHVGLP